MKEAWRAGAGQEAASCGEGRRQSEKMDAEAGVWATEQGLQGTVAKDWEDVT